MLLNAFTCNGSISMFDAISSAGCDMKTAPTSTMSNTENILMNILVPSPKYLPIISGRLTPLFLSEMTPATKSCMAPMKMPPRVIHRNATGPYAAPRRAPKMGPSPAMLSSWMRKTFHRGMGR